MMDPTPWLLKSGEQPQTKFVDNLDAIRVELISWPQEHVLTAMARFLCLNFSPDPTPEQVWQHEQAILAGNCLGLAAEHPNFMFIVRGMSLNCCLQLVRQRIGITFSGQSSYNRDARHDDALVPRAFQRREDLLERYMNWVRMGKKLYADMMDSGELGSIDARMCLPRSLPNAYGMSVCLSTLALMYSKRSCTQCEALDMNEIFRQCKELVVAKFPWAEKMFVRSCDAGRCANQRPDMPVVFKRDARHPGSDELAMFPGMTRDDACGANLESIHGLLAELDTGFSDVPWTLPDVP